MGRDKVERGKDRGYDRVKERDRDKSDRGKDRDREKDKDGERGKDRDRDRGRERDRTHQGKGRDAKDREKHKDSREENGVGWRDKGRDKERDKGGRDRDVDERNRKRHRSGSREDDRRDHDGKKKRNVDSIKERGVTMGYGEDEEEEEEGAITELPPPVVSPSQVDIERIKPNVAESQGEISMSVEETNRVRLMLGLKPLNVGGSNSKPTQEEIAVENMRRKREEDDKAKELRDLETRLNRARIKRQLNEKLKGERLGEVKEGEEVGSAAEWVKRSRNRQIEMEEERLLARQRARILEEQERALDQGGEYGDGEEEEVGEGKGKEVGEGKGNGSAYSADNLAGLKVTHSASAFEAGDSVVLTLKDQPVLEEDDHGMVKGLAEHEDELENVNMKEAERRAEVERESLRAKRGPYQAYDDDEFEGEVGPGAQRKVLSHYDEVKKTGAKMTLGQGGLAVAGAGEGGEEEGGGGKSQRRVAESLKVETKTASEYFTSEEMAKFKKPKKMRKKKLRKREGPGASSAAGLEAAIADVTVANNATVSGSGVSSVAGGKATEPKEGGRRDHGSRGGRAEAVAAAEAAAAAEKRARFDRAVTKATEKSNEKLADSVKPLPAMSTVIDQQQRQQQQLQGEEFEDDVDPDLAASLARARRLAQQRARSQARSKRDVGEAVREAMSKVVVKKEPGVDEEGEGEVDGAGAGAETVWEEKEGHGKPVAMKVEGEEEAGQGIGVKKEDGGMVFTSTTEFTSRLQATLEERKREKVAALEKEKIRDENDAEARKMKQSKRDAMDVERNAQEAAKEIKDAQEKAKKIQARWTTEGQEEEGGEEEEEEEVDEEDLELMAEGAEDSDDDEQLGFVHKQPLVKSGMAATLALLRPSGDLVDKFHRAGRAKDPRRFHGEKEETREDREKGVKLDYRDEWGREITRKEAFRQLCYQFHGYGSGKKKQDKRIKALEEEKKRERAMDLQTLKTLQKAQEATHQAFVVVQGGSSAGAALPPPPSMDLKKKKKPSP